jgi:hypothetical protein
VERQLKDNIFCASKQLEGCNNKTMGKLQTHNVAKDAVVPQLVNFYEQTKVDNYCK